MVLLPTVVQPTLLIEQGRESPIRLAALIQCCILTLLDEHDSMLTFIN